MKSSLIQRLALSSDKEGVLALAHEGHQVHSPSDIIHDPYVLEFTGIPQRKRYRESELEKALGRAVTRAESTVLKVEMTDECLNTIKSARTELIKAETTLLANHRRMMLQEIRNQNEELLSLIKSGKGVYLSPKVFWWWAGITYLTSLYSLWGLLQLILQWLKC